MAAAISKLDLIADLGQTSVYACIYPASVGCFYVQFAVRTKYRYGLNFDGPHVVTCPLPPVAVDKPLLILIRFVYLHV